MHFFDKKLIYSVKMNEINAVISETENNNFTKI